MPNLVPIALTPWRVINQAIMRGILSGRIHTDIELGENESAAINVQRRAESWIPASLAFVHPYEGCPEPTKDARGATHFDLLPDRKGSKLTAPNADSISVRLAQYVRISGLLGVAALSRPVTARGSATRNVPDHLSGMCPDERCNFVPDVPDALTQEELRFASRYRDSMKGEKFSEAMDKASKIRANAYWRNAFPYWPIDKAGRMMQGMMIGGQRMFDLGGNLVSLKTLYEAHVKAEAQTDKDADTQRKSRAAELAALIAEQKEDAKRSKRGRI